MAVEPAATRPSTMAPATGRRWRTRRASILLSIRCRAPCARRRSAERLDHRVRVDRGAATGVVLEVEVRRAGGGVAGRAVVGDQLARLDGRARMDAGGVPRQVGVVVLVPVDALEVQRDAAERAR